MPGTLFVVATPIGNLEDLTFRALRTLSEVDLIAAEDTRRTAKLLAHYEIRKPLTSYREHNEARETLRLVRRLEAGESIALVTDAGTPGIADPGARLVAAARTAGLPIVPIPGPSAVATALSVAGMDFSEFTFMGFPPASGQARVLWLERLSGEPRPVVVFEAPHRIVRTLDDIAVYRSKNQIIVFRELTKINEEFIEWDINKDRQVPLERGEFVIVVAPVPGKRDMAGEDLDRAHAVASALESGGFGRDEATMLAANAVGLDHRSLRKALKQLRISVKQQRNRPS